MGEQVQFSGRESEVVTLLLEGKSNKQIALSLGISVRTVEYHLSNIYAKLGVTSRTEAAVKLTDGKNCCLQCDNSSIVSIHPMK